MISGTVYTVGELRSFIADMPDSVPIYIDGCGLKLSRTSDRAFLLADVGEEGKELCTTACTTAGGGGSDSEED